MTDFWPLIGVVIIAAGLALKLNLLLVILAAGVVTGLVTDISPVNIPAESFTNNRYIAVYSAVADDWHAGALWFARAG